jgi:transcriptional regulator with XRE-family HTH domain
MLSRLHLFFNDEKKEVTMSRRRVPIRQSQLVLRFAERLRSVRLSRGITQAELSRIGSITASYLSRLEAGKVAPGIDMVERLAQVLGVSPSDLLPSTPPPDALPVLKEQAKQLLGVLLEQSDEDAFLRLNPLLALLVEASTKRGDKRK